MFLYIRDIVEAIERIESYTKGLTEERFREQTLIHEAVLWNFQIIGEAARHIESDFSDEEADTSVPWRDIIDARNKITHEYFGIDLGEIWYVIEYELHPLKKQVLELEHRYSQSE